MAVCFDYVQQQQSELALAAHPFVTERRDRVRQAIGALRTLARVGFLLAALLIVLNVMALGHTGKRYRYFYDFQHGRYTYSTTKLRFPVLGITTPGLWFGIPEFLLCLGVIVFGRKKFDHVAHSSHPTLSLHAVAVGTVLSLPFAMMSLLAGLATLFGVVTLNDLSYSDDYTWNSHFIAITVLSGALGLINIITCIHFCITFCCIPSHSLPQAVRVPAVVTLPWATPKLLEETIKRSACAEKLPPRDDPACIAASGPATSPPPSYALTSASLSSSSALPSRQCLQEQSETFSLPFRHDSTPPAYGRPLDGHDHHGSTRSSASDRSWLV